MCSTSRSASKPVRLGVVAVGVVTSTGVVKALAFFDNGTDTTLVKERFADERQLAKGAMSLAVSTVGGTQVLTAGRLRLQLISLDTNEEIEPKGALTLADLPMRAPRSVNAILTRWPHLQDVTIVDWEDDEVDLLIGCDVPEAH